MELTELEDLESLYCEMHKDVFGVKARWYKAESVEQARLDLEWLQAEMTAQIEREKQFEQSAIANAERYIADCIALGAKSREDALRWMHDANQTNGDDDYLCYKLGVPYGYFFKEENAIPA